MKFKNYFWMTRHAQIGLRLLFASLFLFLGNFVAAGIAMLFPAFKYNPFAFHIGAGDPTAEEKALLDKIEKGTEKLVRELTKENVKQDAIDKAVEKLNKDIAKLSEEGMGELNKKLTKLSEQHEALQKEMKEANDVIKTQGGELKAIKEIGKGPAKDEPVTLRKAMETAIMEAKEKYKASGFLTEKNDEYGQRLSLKDYFDAGNRTTPVFTIKAAIDMFQSSMNGNYVNLLRLTELDPQRVGIPLTIYPHVTDVFKTKNIKKPYMSLLVVWDYFDGTATKAEGAASTKSSFKLKTVQFPAFYISTYFTLSDETLDDLDEVLDEISNVAPDKILDLIDTKILGTAGDDVSDIAGILTATKKTDYATVLGATTIKSANITDVVADAKLQCENAKYKPNAIYFSPTTIAKLAAEKNTFEDSKSDRRVQYDALGNPVFICGLRILASTAVVANTFILFDSAQPWIGKRADMSMEIGYNGTDLTEGQKTAILKIRVAFGVRDKAAVIYCSDIDAAVAALDLP